MKQGTVKVSEEFIKPDGTKKWYTHEKQYNQDTEDPVDVFAKAEEQMNIYVKKSNQVTSIDSMPPGPPPVINVERTSEDKRIAELIRDIYACTRLDGNDGLWTYYTLANTNKEAQAAYDIMKNKLVSIESKEILDASNEYVAKTKKR